MKNGTLAVRAHAAERDSRGSSWAAREEAPQVDELDVARPRRLVDRARVAAVRGLRRGAVVHREEEPDRGARREGDLPPDGHVAPHLGLYAHVARGAAQPRELDVVPQEDALVRPHLVVAEIELGEQIDVGEDETD